MTRSIRDVRRQQELTQTAFAQLLGKTQGLIGKEARGDVRLPTDTWWSMAEALGFRSRSASRVLGTAHGRPPHHGGDACHRRGKRSQRSPQCLSAKERAARQRTSLSAIDLRKD